MPFTTSWISCLSDSGTFVWPSSGCSVGGEEIFYFDALWYWKFEKLISRVNFNTFSGVGGYVSPKILALTPHEKSCLQVLGGKKAPP